jgi:hypothetical protein
MAEQVLAKLAVQIAANTAQFNAGLKSAQSQFSSFTNGITKIAGTIGAAFGVQQVVSFGLEISKLAGEAEGVRAAFDRLPDSVRVLQQMKAATGGTVSELELMKNAVQANNFQIPIENLGKLFQFATLRAQQTGQSVDYLVQSIILGIGRKSPLILDNLGISAVRLREKLRGVSAEVATVGDVAKVVGDIAEEELGNMAGFSDNAATKIQRLSASWENLKVAVGDAANESGALNKFLDVLTRTINLSAGDKVTTALVGLNNSLDNGRLNEFVDKIALLISQGTEFKLTSQQIQSAIGASASEAERMLKAIDEANKRAVTLKANATGAIEVDPESGLPLEGGTPFKREEVVPVIETLKTLNDEVKRLRDEFENTPTGDILRLRELDASIESTLLKIENLKNRVAGVRKEISGALETLSDTSAIPVTGGNIGTSLPQFSVPPLDTSLYIQSLQHVRTATEETFAAVGKEIQDVGPMIAGAVTNIAASLGRAAAGTEDFGKSLLSVIGDFAQQFGSVLIATGIGTIALESGDPYAMIAGGAILVAAGAALNALSQRRSNISSEFSGSGGGSSTSFNQSSFNSAGEIQNSQIVLVPDIQIKGSDMWLIFNNYEKERGYTHG